MKALPAFAAAWLLLAGSAVQAEPSALVRVAAARQGALALRITAFGTVAADTNHVTTIAAPRDCLVAHIAIRPGQSVAAGDPLVTISTAPAATTQYRQAQSTLAFAEKDLAHTRELYAEQLATRSQVAAAEKALSDARAQMSEQTRIGANQPTETLRAPVAGVVASITGSPGDRVQQGASIAAIATRNQLVLNVGLEPRDAPRLGVGTPVQLRQPAGAGSAISGRVLSVSAMMDSQSRLVNAVVAVPQEKARGLILGTVMQAEMTLAPAAGIIVPKDSLMTDGQGTYVYVVQKGEAHRRNVLLAFESGDQALVTSGLSGNEEVVTAGNAGLEDNMAVRMH